MNSLDSLRMMVRNYPGGIKVVSERIGKPVKTLEKELGNTSGHKLGVIDAEAITALCVEQRSPHCFAYVNSVAADCGGFIELTLSEGVASQCIQRGMAAVLREVSEVVSTVTDADADDVFSDNETKKSLKEIGDARAELQRLEQIIRSKHAAGKKRRPV